MKNSMDRYSERLTLHVYSLLFGKPCQIVIFIAACGMMTFCLLQKKPSQAADNPYPCLWDAGPSNTFQHPSADIKHPGNVPSWLSDPSQIVVVALVWCFAKRMCHLFFENHVSQRWSPYPCPCESCKLNVHVESVLDVQRCGLMQLVLVGRCMPGACVWDTLSDCLHRWGWFQQRCLGRLAPCPSSSHGALAGEAGGGALGGSCQQEARHRLPPQQSS